MPGLGLFGFAAIGELQLGDLDWVKFPVVYMIGLAFYYTYNKYNSRRKFDVEELKIAIETNRDLIGNYKEDIKSLKVENKELRDEILSLMSENQQLLKQIKNNTNE